VNATTGASDMNTKEFIELKENDKICNMQNGVNAVGTVVGIAADGVRVVWGERSPNEKPFFYSVQTTAWMHWSKADGAQSEAD
jgi:hypothetical protein